MTIVYGFVVDDGYGHIGGAHYQVERKVEISTTAGL